MVGRRRTKFTKKRNQITTNVGNVVDMDIRKMNVPHLSKEQKLSFHLNPEIYQEHLML
jgi:hypothetical protein